MSEKERGMGWREATISALQAVNGVDPEYDDGVDADAIHTALLTIPPADRIALARELLAGTDHEIKKVWPKPAPLSPAEAERRRLARSPTVAEQLEPTP